MFCIACVNQIIQAQTSGFTYQGKLTDGGTAANGPYDLIFRLFDAAAGGTQVGGDVIRDDVQVTTGVFTVNLDFGASPFTSATGNFLEISVRAGASTGAFTPLSPLQPLTSSPYAVQTLRAASAAIADNSSQLGGVDASQYVQDSDSRLTDARMPLAGSSDYVQSNPLAQQPGTNLNIGGSATVGGTLSGNIVNATTQYNIGGNRVLSVSGISNIFAGVNAGAVNAGANNAFFGTRAGQANTIGNNNSFFGRSAGQANTDGGLNTFFGSAAGINNTTGSSNAFFGTLTGEFNTTGSSNSFFGSSAGEVNTDGGFNAFFGVRAGDSNTSGQSNSFFGPLAGEANTTGINNTIIGSFANVGSGNLSYATAIGASAVVSTSDTIVLGRSAGQETVQIPGNLNVAGSFTGSFTVPASNITGVLSPTQGGTGLSSPGVNGLFLRSDGAQWTSSGLQVSDIPAGNTNYIQNIPGIGQQTASFNITGGGTANIFNAATQFNIGGQRMLSATGDNTFVGRNAGLENTFGGFNSFFGQDAGRSNTMASGNSFFGDSAGFRNTDGGSNSFFGHAAGKFNTTGGNNSFFGAVVAQSNAEGFSNSFFGMSAGFSNTTGSNNSFFGMSAGQSNTTGAKNTIIGFGANVGAGNLTNATAIGADALVSQSNSLVLGSGVNVGIGTSAPSFRLHINDSQNFGLRVQTDLAGGTVASFGGNGAFQIDAVGVAGGRLNVAQNGNVGIGTNSPNTKLQVVGGNVYIANPNSLIITSPNGACWFITVNNAGALSTIAVPCP